MSYNLTNKKALFDNMRLSVKNSEKQIAEIENPVSENWSVFRTWLLPSLMEFLSKNKHNEYPQEIFEIGDVVLVDEKAETKTQDVRKLAVAITDNTVNYEKAASQLDVLLRALEIEYKLEKTKYDSFINGRAASINVKNKNGKMVSIGIIGEIHPQCLNNWSIETPVLALELNADELFKLIKD